MNSEDSKSINEALQVIYNSKADNYLALSTVINDQLKIVLEKFPKISIPSDNIDMLKLLRFLREYIINLSNEYVIKAKILDKENEIIKQSCYDNLAKLTNKLDKIELKTEIDKSKNEKVKSELKSEIDFLKKEIDKLKEIINSNETEKSKMNREIANLAIKVDNLEEEKSNLAIKVDNLEEEKSKLAKEIRELKVDKGRLEIKIESLNKTIIEQEKFKKSAIKDIDEQKKKNEYFEKKDKELSEKFRLFENQIIGIQNRDNYKSIIYILLIFSGNNFKDIGGSVFDLIENNVKNKEIQKILKEAYRFYDYHRSSAHNGYNSEIMVLLFPTSKFKDKIGDNLINKTKNLLTRYENPWNLNDPMKQSEIEKDIELLTSEIRKLNLFN